MKLRAIDLFCGGGGVTKGLQNAGFHVTGVDINPQPRYCGDEFHQGDALAFDVSGFDLICASPPCQRYSLASKSQRNAGKEYPDLLPSTREKLKNSGCHWIMENVPGAPMRPDIVLCGSMFGLRVIRHRWYECSFPVFDLFPPCQHPSNPVVCVGHGTTSWARAKNGGKCHTVAEVREAMGIDWMNRDEMSQAIPPAYSEFLARKFLGWIASTENKVVA